MKSRITGKRVQQFESLSAAASTSAPRPSRPPQAPPELETPFSALNGPAPSQLAQHQLDKGEQATTESRRTPESSTEKHNMQPAEPRLPPTAAGSDANQRRGGSGAGLQGAGRAGSDEEQQQPSQHQLENNANLGSELGAVDGPTSEREDHQGKREEEESSVSRQAFKKERAEERQQQRKEEEEEEEVSQAEDLDRQAECHSTPVRPTKDDELGNDARQLPATSTSAATPDDFETVRVAELHVELAKHGSVSLPSLQRSSLQGRSAKLESEAEPTSKEESAVGGGGNKARGRPGRLVRRLTSILQRLLGAQYDKKEPVPLATRLDREERCTGADQADQVLVLVEARELSKSQAAGNKWRQTSLGCEPGQLKTPLLTLQRPSSAGELESDRKCQSALELRVLESCEVRAACEELQPPDRGCDSPARPRSPLARARRLLARILRQEPAAKIYRQQPGRRASLSEPTAAVTSHKQLDAKQLQEEHKAALATAAFNQTETLSKPEGANSMSADSLQAPGGCK